MTITCMDVDMIFFKSIKKISFKKIKWFSYNLNYCRGGATPGRSHSPAYVFINRCEVDVVGVTGRDLRDCLVTSPSPLGLFARNREHPMYLMCLARS